MKSNEEVSRVILSKVNALLLQYRPTPSCQQKQRRNEWDIEQIKKQVAAKLNPEALGVNITITP